MSSEKFGKEIRKEGLRDSSAWEEMYETKEIAERGFAHMEHYLTSNGIILDKNSKILEVGSGTGRLLAAMKERGLDAVGLDARPRTEDPQPIVVAQIEQMPFPDETFDIVFSIGVFDQRVYEQDHRAMLDEIARVLKKGGALFMVGSNWFNESTPPDSAGLRLVSDAKDKQLRALYKKE
jgi:ubiquinone/menaquinone biosynthesis C-methylase UbiE